MPGAPRTLRSSGFGSGGSRWKRRRVKGRRRGKMQGLGSVGKGCEGLRAQNVLVPLGYPSRLCSRCCAFLPSLPILLKCGEGSEGLFFARISSEVRLFSILYARFYGNFPSVPGLKYAQEVRLDLAKLEDAGAFLALPAPRTSPQYLLFPKPSSLLPSSLAQSLLKR